MFRLLYVSRNCLPEAQADNIFDGIVAVSHARNARQTVTGALMSTGVSFAGVFEGERDAVLSLMAAIAQDHGHHDVWIAQQDAVKARHYDRWSVVYRGVALIRSAWSSRCARRRTITCSFAAPWTRCRASYANSSAIAQWPDGGGYSAAAGAGALRRRLTNHSHTPVT